MFIKSLSAILFLFINLLSSHVAYAQHIKIVNLKTEYTETPLGIDVEIPRFSWQMQSGENGSCQKGYQIVVTDETGQEVWNSGKTDSNISLNIRYGGTTLRPTTRYNWQLTVWDNKNKQYTASSWFETGLMNAKSLRGNPDNIAWSNAKWIGGSYEDIVLYSHYLPVFRIDYTLQFEEQSKSVRAGFIYGANDNRLMNKYMNIYHIENKKDKSYIQIEIDISPLASGKEAVLNIYRVGFHPEDKKDIPVKSYNIPPTILNRQNKYEKQQIAILTNFGHTRIFMGGERKENQVAELNLNPLGQGGDYIAFPVVGDIGFIVPENQSAIFSNIEIRNLRAPSNILFRKDTEVLNGGTTGIFLTFNPGRNSMPMLRTTFNSSEKEILKARLYVTSRGIYEIYINGERLGNDYFNPGLTQYNKTHLYQTFDVISYLKNGSNAIGALLAEGWWSGGATYSGDGWNFFGDRQSLLAKLVITYADGKEDVIVTNPDTWQYFNNGPIVYGSFFQGEVYDASKEASIEGWSTTTYDASGWTQAREVPLKEHISFEEGSYSGVAFIGQYDQTVKQIKELTAQSVEEVRPGVFVYDMGQNMVGIPQIKLNGLKPGQKIILRFAEVKYPGLPEYKDNTGMIMLENIRGAMAQDIYIAKGGNEMIRPRFTFHGYRFIEITGVENAPPLEAVKGLVISSIHELSSSYETSNPKVNKLWENITWSTYGNFLSIPTDCPQRNERMGWSGDISVFARTATYLADVPQFLRRHMRAMRDTQFEDGRFPDVAPLGVGFGGILWGSAGLTVAWETYQQYNDIDILTEHYNAMKRYIGYILDKTIDPETGIIVQNRAWGDLADWLGPEDGRNDKSLLWEAYFIYDLEIMNKIATALGKKDDAAGYAKLYNERKEFFNKTYIQAGTGKTVFSAFDTKRTGDMVDTQTSYVLPLAFNLAKEHNKEKISSNLAATVTRENKADNEVVCPPYSLMTGFIGTAWINKALSDNGYTDIAYRLLQQTSYPSWLYSVEQGATTIWERLNSYTHTHGFGGNNSMNSFNHYSFGAVGAWMYNYSLGIVRDENSPGFKHFLLKPEPDPTGEMTYAKGHYVSMYGRIESNWEKKGDGYNYRFTIPANTTATLYLNASSEKNIRNGEKPFKSVKGVTYTGEENGKHVFELQSGQYEILVK